MECCNAFGFGACHLFMLISAPLCILLAIGGQIYGCSPTLRASGFGESYTCNENEEQLLLCIPIVDDDGKVIGRKPIPLSNDEVLEGTKYYHTRADRERDDIHVEEELVVMVVVALMNLIEV